MDTPPSFTALANQKLPAVVNVSTRQKMAETRGPQMPQLPPGSPLEDLFRNYFGEGQETQRREVMALGSGFIISSDGYVVTNNHVVENAAEITVILHDDTELAARLVGRDALSDLALLKVESTRPLPVVGWGDSTKLEIGEWVLAIGNPFGLGGTVTAGIVSARARDIHAGPYDEFLQTDAAINQGNSGGPLFAMDGTVVGVNTAIFSPTGGSVGIGFAIPSSLAQPVIEQLRQSGAVRRGYLGVQLQPITPDIANALGLGSHRGALVADVSRNSPAAAAKIEPGDVILSFDGKEISDPRTLSRAVATAGPNAEADVTLLRDNQTIHQRVRLAELRSREAQASGGDTGAPRNVQLGLNLAPLDSNLRQRLGVSDETSGVAVVGVAPGSAAAEHGLRPGDIIVSAGQQKVSRPEQVTSAVRTARDKGQKAILMRVQRGDAAMFVPLPLG